MRKIAEFIVNKRWFIAAVFVALIVYCAFGITKVKVEYDITRYLPDDTDTAQALDIMNEEFVTYGTATFMVKDVSPEKAEALAADIRKLDGVKDLTFSADSPKTYSAEKRAALITVTYDGKTTGYGGATDYKGDGTDERAKRAYSDTVELLDKGGYKYAVPVPLVNDYADTLANEMIIIIAIAAAVVLAVLLFTSKSFAEIIAFPIVFVVAALLNMGTNYWLGTISFASNTVCIILQLALAIDYAIILCHRFTEEKDKRKGDPKSALITALAHAIPEIASSSLTTVSGLVALMFMQLGLGLDLGLVLAKSIVCSLLTVFLLMPCLLLSLSKAMDKSRHRSFVPKIRFLGKGVIKARYVLICVFVVLFGVGAALSQNIEFCYSQNGIDTSRPTATAVAQAEADETFGYNNMFVILVPNDGDYEKQQRVLELVGGYETQAGERLIDSAIGLAGIPIKEKPNGGSYMLGDSINFQDFGEITGLGRILSVAVFGLYAAEHKLDIADYKEFRIPAVDLFEWLLGKDELMSMAGGFADVDALKAQLEYGKEQLVGKDHVRLVFNINAGIEDARVIEMIDRLTPTVKAEYPSAIFAGMSMSAYDLNSSFSRDNLMITLLTVAFIFLILAVTFRSPCIPIVLVFIIQGAIFMNFSLPVIIGNNLFFFTYLIISAIQMGATIDYAILMTNRFMRLGEKKNRRDALVEAVSETFPTVITSGLIMTVAAFLVGLITSDPLIASMGMTLGFGTVISIVSVMIFLPAFLYTLAPLLKKTVVKRKPRAKDIRIENPSDIPYFS